MAKIIATTFLVGADASQIVESCGLELPSEVEDCQNVDFGSCDGGACCKLEFEIMGTPVTVLDKLKAKLVDLTPTGSSMGFDHIGQLEGGPASGDSACCVPAGTFTCTGPVYADGSVVDFSERDTLEPFGRDNAFLNYSIQSIDSNFTENEVYTRLPGACGRWSGATMHRSDVGAGDQVVFEDLFFSPDCSNFTKVVKGQANPGPVVARIQCLRDASAGEVALDLKLIVEVSHTTMSPGHVDYISFNIRNSTAVEMNGSHSTVMAHSISGIDGALSDNGQNYKNIMTAMKAAFGNEIHATSVDGSCPSASSDMVV